MRSNPTHTDLKAHIANFKDWLKAGSGNAAGWQKEREERLAWYRKYLTQERLADLSRDDFATLIKSLWAVNIWHNKDYKVEQLIKDNGLDGLKASLGKLLHGSDPVEHRWDDFRASVKGLGPSSLSEILTFFDPQQYALINLKPYQVLPRIGFSVGPVKDGRSYKKAVEEIGKVKRLLEEDGVEGADFIVTDFFIAYLFYEVFDLQFKRKEEQGLPVAEKGVAKESSVVPAAQKDFVINSHESAEAVLLMLGKLLGYDTYTPDAGRTYEEQKLGDIATLEDLPYFAGEKVMDSVRNVDVVWLKDEWPEYFFEVEHTTGVTSGLLRIYQAEKLNSKFLIVGPKDVLGRFEREVEKAPFNRIKEKYRFHSYDELREMYLAASSYRKISDEFLG
jgi:hypothetical protein